eukprot:Skav218092  [mRNA]  locus=scaffold1801:85745:89432:- [translate_table: standard]
MNSSVVMKQESIEWGLQAGSAQEVASSDSEIQEASSSEGESELSSDSAPSDFEIATGQPHCRRPGDSPLHEAPATRKLPQVEREARKTQLRKPLVKEKSDRPDYTHKTELETFEALRPRGLRLQRYGFLEGVDLVGQIPDSGFWPKKFSPLVIALDDLAECSKQDRAAIVSRMAIPMEDNVQPQQEVELGWLSSEIPLCDIPVTSPLSRRFGIGQGEKVGCVDDFSESSVNATVEAGECPRPHTLDVVAGLILECMSLRNDAGAWVIRTFDLKNAHRQCYVSVASLKNSHIGVLDPPHVSIAVWECQECSLIPSDRS